MKKCWVISSESEDGYWSNEIGWVASIVDATHFTVNTQNQPEFNLPMSSANDAEWCLCGVPTHEHGTEA
jgi:hypothetical protein